MANIFPISVFISGRGSNLKALLDYQGRYTVVCVVSNKECEGLKFAKEKNIPTFVYSKTDFQTRLDQQEAMFKCAESFNAKLIVLAGFMQIVEKPLADKWHGKIINIHPSLLPKLPGLDTHKRALEEKLNIHGCTVHFVDSGLDTGPIIAQKKVLIEHDETENSLAKKVLEHEHKILPWVVDNFATLDLKLEQNKLFLVKKFKNQL